MCTGTAGEWEIGKILNQCVFSKCIPSDNEIMLVVAEIEPALLLLCAFTDQSGNCEDRKVFDQICVNLHAIPAFELINIIGGFL